MITYMNIIFAYNICCSYACSLLRQGMNQIIINLETPDIIATEKGGDKDATARVNTYLVTPQPHPRTFISLSQSFSG